MLLIPACVQTVRLFHSTRRHGFDYGVGLALIHGLPDQVHAHRNLGAVDPCVWYLFCIVEPDDQGKKIMIAHNLIWFANFVFAMLIVGLVLNPLVEILPVLERLGHNAAKRLMNRNK